MIVFCSRVRYYPSDVGGRILGYGVLISLLIPRKSSLLSIVGAPCPVHGRVVAGGFLDQLLWG